jgi:hypothetical protein
MDARVINTSPWGAVFGDDVCCKTVPSSSSVVYRSTAFVLLFVLLTYVFHIVIERSPRLGSLVLLCFPFWTKRKSFLTSLEYWRSSVFAHLSALCATLVYIKLQDIYFCIFLSFSFLFFLLVGRWQHCHTLCSISTGRIQPVRSQSPRTQAADDDRHPHADLTETIALRQVIMIDLPGFHIGVGGAAAFFILFKKMS